jgi:hypothetical protein
VVWAGVKPNTQTLFGPKTADLAISTFLNVNCVHDLPFQCRP